MKNIYSTLLLLLISTTTLHAQIESILKTSPPESIYALNYFHSGSITDFSPADHIDIPNYDFIYVSFDDLENNSFSFNLKDLWRKPTRFIYDDYIHYNNNPLRGFLRQQDPTRWFCPVMP
ncbi:MAG: hypothetical protein JXQ93_02625 [Flavobacteriaceae bacterium]